MLGNKKRILWCSILFLTTVCFIHFACSSKQRTIVQSDDSIKITDGLSIENLERKNYQCRQIDKTTTFEQYDTIKVEYHEVTIPKGQEIKIIDSSDYQMVISGDNPEILLNMTAFTLNYYFDSKEKAKHLFSSDFLNLRLEDSTATILGSGLGTFQDLNAFWLRINKFDEVGQSKKFNVIF